MSGPHLYEWSKKTAEAILSGDYSHSAAAQRALARAYLDLLALHNEQDRAMVTEAHSAGYRAGCEAAAKEAESLAERLEDNARTCPTARGGIFACRTLLAALRTLDAGEQKTVEP